MNSKKIIIKHLQKYHKLKKVQKQTLKKQAEQRIESLLDIEDILQSPGVTLIMGFPPAVNCGMVINEDFKDAVHHVSSKCPDTNLESIRAFLIPYKTMDSISRLKSCGGCYIPDIKTILMKEGYDSSKTQSKVSSLLRQYSLCCSHQDVLVHELFHAVSHLSARSTRRFIHLEEEFVYKSTIEWLRSQGLNDDEIIEKNFLPFVIQDVLQQDRAEIVVGIGTANGEQINQNQLSDVGFLEPFIEKHAEEFVKEVVERARKIGRHMIGFSAEKEKRFDRFSVLDFS